MSGEPPAPPHQPGSPPQPPEGPPRRAIPPEVRTGLRDGWGRAAAAATAFAILFAVSFGLTAIQHLTAPEALEVGGRSLDAPEVPLARAPAAALGGLYVWHGVSFDIRVEQAIPAAGVPVGIDVSFAVALIAGTLLAGAVLFAAGKRVGAALDGPAWLRPLHGLKVALPYGLLGLVASPLAGVSQAFAGVPLAAAGVERFDARISPLSALVMPLLLAAVAAGAGALSSAPRDGNGPLVRVRAVLAAGWRMTWASIALAVVGFLVVAALHPDVTRAYLEFVSQDGAAGMVRAALTTAVLLGNAGVVVGAFASGGAVAFSAFGRSCTVLSYLRFPSEVTRGGGDDLCSSVPLDYGTAPWPYLLFLLVPGVAAVAGGVLAARRARSEGPREGATLGALAGLPYAGLMAVLGAMGALSYDVDAAAFPTIEASLGPVLPSLFLLSMAWGLAGGAFGGWIEGRRTPRLAGGATPGPG